MIAPTMLPTAMKMVPSGLWFGFHIFGLPAADGGVTVAVYEVLVEDLLFELDETVGVVAAVLVDSLGRSLASISIARLVRCW